MTPHDARTAYQLERSKRPDLVIAKAIGCPRAPSTAELAETAPTKRPRVTGAERTARDELFVRLYCAELRTVTEIAEATGYTHTTILKVLRARNITLRTRGQKQLLLRAERELVTLRRDNLILKQRLAGLRRQLRARGIAELPAQEAA